MTQMLKRFAAISLSVIMALTIFPLLGGMTNVQTAFADDEIVQDDGSATGGEKAANTEESAAKDEALNDQEPSVEAAQEKDKESIKDKTQSVLKSEDEEEWDYADIFIDDDDIQLYSDGTKEYYLEFESRGDCELQVRVGLGYGDEWDSWDTLLEEGKHFTVEDYDDWATLSLDGAAIYESIKDSGYTTVDVVVALINGDSIRAMSTTCTTVCEPTVSYDDFDEIELNTELFPGEKAVKVPKTTWAEVYNGDYPDGDELKCSVTKVTSSDPTVIKVTEKKTYWALSPLKKGEAKVTVSFKDYNKKAATREFDFSVVAGRVKIGDIEVKGYFQGVPGESTELEAYAWFESEDGYDEWEGLDYSWSVVGGEDFADITVDSDDPSKAELTFKNGANLQDEQQITVRVEASYKDDDGTTYTGTYDYKSLYAVLEYDLLMLKEDGDLVPADDHYTSNDLGIGKKLTFEPKETTHKYNKDTDEPEIIEVEDVTYDVETDSKKIIAVTPNSNNTVFTLDRKSAKACDIHITADYTGEYGETDDSSYFYFDAIRTDLSQYYIEFEDSVDNWAYYIDSPEGITPEIKVCDQQTGEYELPEEEYDLVITKQRDWEDDSKFDPASMPFKYDYNADDPTAPGNGVAIYRVQAKAKSGSKYFKGATDKNDGYLYIYSTKTLTPWAASIEVDKEYDQYLSKKVIFEGGSIIYEMPLGLDFSAENVTVKANNDKDVLTTDDFRVEYKLWGEADAPILNEYPTETGIYDLRIVGQGEYFGMNDWITVFVGEKNPATIKATTKSVKYSKVKKKAQTVTPISVKNKLGAVTYEKISGSKYLTISSTTGKVKVKKKTKKGTYKASILVYADGDATHAPALQMVNITVKVKK